MIKVEETSHGRLGKGIQSYKVTGTTFPSSLTPQEIYSLYRLSSKIEHVCSRADYLSLIEYMKEIIEKYSFVREISFNE
jgi:hypothetical protein